MWFEPIRLDSYPRAVGNFFTGPQRQRPWIVALTRLIGLRRAVRLGQDVVNAAGLQHFADAGPAFTPVPGPAGTRTT